MNFGVVHDLEERLVDGRAPSSPSSPGLDARHEWPHRTGKVVTLGVVESSSRLAINARH